MTAQHRRVVVVAASAQAGQTRRAYHATPQTEFLYPAILVVAAIGYVGYKTYVGEPLTPKSATDGKNEFEKLEKDRLERNRRKRSVFQQQNAATSSEKDGEQQQPSDKRPQ